LGRDLKRRYLQNVNNESLITSSKLIDDVIDLSESLPFVGAAIDSVVSGAKIRSLGSIFNSFLEKLPESSAAVYLSLLNSFGMILVPTRAINNK